LRHTLYLKLACDRLSLTHLESGRSLELQAVPPFSSTRLLVADFSAAEHLLKRAISELLPRSFLRLSLAHKLLVQPLERIEGGLSQVEERVLLELGLGSGARKVRIHVGAELDAAAVRKHLAT